MRTSFLIAILFATVSCFGQSSKFFKQFDFDSSYAVIGVGPHWNKSGDNLLRFSFIINKFQDLLELKKDWTFKDKANSIVEDNSFNIYITKEKELVRSGIINPSVPNIRTSEGWYFFDTTLLLKLHQKFPLQYKRLDTVFKTEDDYHNYFKEARANTAFLFLFEPELHYEGKFTVTLDKTSKLSSPKAAIEELEKQFVKIVSQDKFHLFFVLDSYNMSHQEKMRLTVEGSKLLFDNFKNDVFEKGDWEPLKIEVTSFWQQ